MTRRELDERQSALRTKVRGMASEVCTMILEAVDGVVSDDPTLLESAIGRDSSVDAAETEIIQECFSLVVLQAPVSQDARFFMGTIAVASELQHAGNDAVKLSRRAEKLKRPLGEAFRAPLGALAESVVQMVNDAVNLIDHFDDEEAVSVMRADQQIDSAFKKARDLVLESLAQEERPLDREALRVIQVFHALEHVADHAVEIARRLRPFYAT